jgi:hypothetical protein
LSWINNFAIFFKTLTAVGSSFLFIYSLRVMHNKIFWSLVPEDPVGSKKGSGRGKKRKETGEGEREEGEAQTGKRRRSREGEEGEGEAVPGEEGEAVPRIVNEGATNIEVK